MIPHTLFSIHQRSTITTMRVDQIDLFLKHILDLKSKHYDRVNATVLVPKWSTRSWYKLVKYFDVVKEYDAGEDLFTAPHPYEKNNRRSCGKTKWPVLILRTRNLTLAERSSLVFDSRNIVPDPKVTVSEVFATATLGVDAPVPNTKKQLEAAPDRSEWEASDAKELDSLYKQSVMEEADWPANKNVMGSRMVRKRKYNADGSIEKYKSRLVAQGFSAIFGEDYFETFAPVIQLTALRIMLAICVQLGLHTFQADFETAFLNAPLEEEIYMRMPEGLRKFDDDGKEKCWKLKKSLYGLKQAPRDWNELLVKHLLSLKFGPENKSFEQSQVDPCLFTLRSGDLFCIISIYVDDLSGGSNDPEFATQLIAELRKQFPIEEKEKLHWHATKKSLSVIGVNT
mmetsp:Transcript_17969/g.61249  ORF Transcript_17969/g.61249 Transcript_17969/m.61249 type:complete len:398 (-) Transcript_17969:1278-2471(-)